MTDRNTQPNAAAAGSFDIGGELSVNRLGFGAMRLCGPGIWGEPEDPEAARAVPRRALELGINLIDTADAYGPKVNEWQIAEALYPYPEDLVIATKGGVTRPGRDQWVPEGRPEHLRRACEGSLRRLRLERIDLYQLHTPDPKVPFEESVGALAELREEGKIHHVGLSNVNAGQLEQAQEIVSIASVQNRYNLIHRFSEDVIGLCEREGIAFIPWFPLATGNLAQAGSSLDEMASRHDVAPGQVALAWLLWRSPVMLPIPGTSSVEHLEENVAAAAIELNEAELEELSMLSS
jgi:pyridoxine 4-dehydrogenase